MKRTMITSIMEEIERVRKERKKKEGVKFTQAALAKAAGISVSTYKKYLEGVSDRLTLKAVWRMADYMGCNVEDLVAPACREMGDARWKGN